MDRNVPLFEIYRDEDDVSSVSRVIRRGKSWANGPEIGEFEKMLSKYMGSDFCVLFNSGTSALHAGLLAHDVGPGDEVIVPSFTFIATANAPLFIGAIPVFADIEEELLGLDPADVVKRITPRTKAILPIHYGGSPCRIRELRKIADEHKLILMEDMAESLGATYGGEKVGTFGDSAVLSFCQNKVITTGEGGAVVTDDAYVHEKLILYRSHGRMESGDYFTSTDYMDYVALGYNFRMPTVCASLGISQLRKLSDIIGMRRERAEYMNRGLSDLDGISLPIPKSNDTHVYQMYTIRIHDGREARNGLKEHLLGEGISCKVYFDPVHLTSFYRNKYGHKESDLPVTERISDQVLSLPIYPDLSVEDMDYIIHCIRIFFDTGE